MLLRKTELIRVELRSFLNIYMTLYFLVYSLAAAKLVLASFV